MALTSTKEGGSPFFDDFLLFIIAAPYIVDIVCTPARKRSLAKEIKSELATKQTRYFNFMECPILTSMKDKKCQKKIK